MAYPQPDDMALRSELNLMLDARGHGAASELARRLDVTPQTVAKWRSGQVAVPLGRLIDICIALDEPDPTRLAQLTPGWGMLQESTRAEIAADPGAGATIWRRNFGSRSERETPSPFDTGEVRAPAPTPPSESVLERLARVERQVAELQAALASVTNEQFAFAADADDRPGDDTPARRPAPSDSGEDFDTP